MKRSQTVGDCETAKRELQLKVEAFGNKIGKLEQQCVSQHLQAKSLLSSQHFFMLFLPLFIIFPPHPALPPRLSGTRTSPASHYHSTAAVDAAVNSHTPAPSHHCTSAELVWSCLYFTGGRSFLHLLCGDGQERGGAGGQRRGKHMVS